MCKFRNNICNLIQFPFKQFMIKIIKKDVFYLIDFFTFVYKKKVIQIKNENIEGIYDDVCLYRKYKKRMSTCEKKIPNKNEENVKRITQKC